MPVFKGEQQERCRLVNEVHELGLVLFHRGEAEISPRHRKEIEISVQVGILPKSAVDFKTADGLPLQLCPASARPKGMNGGMWERGLGINHARPYAAAQAAHRLTVIPLARKFEALSKGKFQIRVECPTADLIKARISLTRIVSAEAERK